MVLSAQPHFHSPAFSFSRPSVCFSHHSFIHHNVPPFLICDTPLNLGQTRVLRVQGNDVNIYPSCHFHCVIMWQNVWKAAWCLMCPTFHVALLPLSARLSHFGSLFSFAASLPFLIHPSCFFFLPFPLRSCQGFMHMKFTQCKDGKYVLGQNSPPFDTIPEVIHFYTTHKLPIRGAEHLSLLFPVLVQTLWLTRMLVDFIVIGHIKLECLMGSSAKCRSSLLVGLDSFRWFNTSPTTAVVPVPSVSNIRGIDSH